ncbi:MAG: glycosyltransferase [Verrucomicrobiota bacterium]
MVRVASLREILTGPAKAERNVCLATFEIDGPTIPSELGTFFFNHAKMLTDAGHKVTVLLLRDAPVEGEIDEWIKKFAADEIELVFLPEAKIETEYRNAKELTISYRALEWLETRRFDIVHFHEWRGPAYYFMLARRQGIFPYECRAFVSVHHPHRWLEMMNWRYISRPYHIEVNFMERKSVELADAVVGLTESIQRWMESMGWKLPASRTYAWPGWSGKTDELAVTSSGEDGQARELIFINYGDVSGGVRLLVSTAEELRKRGESGFKVRVLYLGSSGRLTGLNNLIEELCEEWAEKPEVVRLDEVSEIGPLVSGRGRVVLFASGGHHYGSVLSLCLQSGAKVILNEKSPAVELIETSDRRQIAREPRPQAFAERVCELWEAESAAAVDFALDPDEVREQWLRWYAGAPIEQNAVARAWPGVQPRVTVCMPHYNRPDMLQQAINSLEKQTYRNFQLILVDDGSNEPEAVQLLEELEPMFEECGWVILRQKNRGPAVARNWAAQEADGDYLLFMDDDNIAKPDELDSMIRAALSSGAVILCPFIQAFSGEGVPESDDETDWVWLPLGPCAAMGAMSNCFGDTNFLIRSDVFKKLGGFTSDLIDGQIEEDWDILSRAVLSGYEVQVIPRMLFWYRRNENEGAARSISGPRYVKDFAGTLPYSSNVNPDLHDVFLIANALVKGPKTDFAGGKKAKKIIRRQEKAIRSLLKRIESLIKAGRRMQNSSRWKMVNPLRTLKAKFGEKGANEVDKNAPPVAGYAPFEKEVAKLEALKEQVEDLLGNGSN